MILLQQLDTSSNIWYITWYYANKRCRSALAISGDASPFPMPPVWFVHHAPELWSVGHWACEHVSLTWPATVPGKICSPTHCPPEVVFEPYFACKTHCW